MGGWAGLGSKRWETLRDWGRINVAILRPPSDHGSLFHMRERYHLLRVGFPSHPVYHGSLDQPPRAHFPRFALFLKFPPGAQKTRKKIGFPFGHSTYPIKPGENPGGPPLLVFFLGQPRESQPKFKGPSEKQLTFADPPDLLQCEHLAGVCPKKQVRNLWTRRIFLGSARFARTGRCLSA